MRENLLTYTQELLSKNLPFILLRKSGSIAVEIWHQTDQQLYKTPHETLPYGVFSKFDKTQYQVYITGEVTKKFEWTHQPIHRSKNPIVVSNKQRNTHISRVQAAVSHIQANSLQKVVLSLRHDTFRTSTDVEILSNMLDIYPAANCYFFYHPLVGSWMGATPETLISYKDNTIKTMSLAGTKKAASKQDVGWGKKEKEEQQLVTDFIVRALKECANGSLRIGTVETIKAGSLYHLRTLLEASLEFSKIGEAIHQLHPTPAVCGLPRKQALDYIINNENYDRSFYTGYLGVQNTKDQTADYYVNLRCIELTTSRIYLYAGGGITAMSNPEDEMDEIQHKLMTMASIL